jgi:hypothetical protein
MNPDGIGPFLIALGIVAIIASWHIRSRKARAEPREIVPCAIHSWKEWERPYRFVKAEGTLWHDGQFSSCLDAIGWFQDRACGACNRFESRKVRDLTPEEKTAFYALIEFRPKRERRPQEFIR